MKAMPLPFEEHQGKKGVLDFSYAASSPLPPSHSLSPPLQPPQKWACYAGTEPTSVLDTRRSPSPPTSTTSTLSSSNNNCSSSAAGGGGGGGGGGGAATSENPPPPPGLLLEEKCGDGHGTTLEDWESVLSESSGPEQSNILRLIMGDIEHGQPQQEQELEFTPNFIGEDPSFIFNQHKNILDHPSSSSLSDFHFHNQNIPVPIPIQTNNNNLPPLGLNNPNMFQESTQMIINQNQAQFTQNASMFIPFTYSHLPPPAKRFNPGPTGALLDSGQQQHLQPRPNLTMEAVTKQKTDHHELVVDQLFKAAELIESGNPVHAQGILARLNHQLSPIGKPLLRAAFYFKEALQLLLSNPLNLPSNSSSPFSLVFKIGAYKSFSEISPILQFANFTSNQALLESLDGFDQIHIIDFDIGFGGQWASLMQELALRNGGAGPPPFLKITVFASPYSSNQDEFELELSLTRENLKHFASDLNIGFELEILSLELLSSGSWPSPLHISENEAIAVNLPIGSFSNPYPISSLPVILRFVKHLSPKIVVSLDRGMDRNDALFSHHVITALQSFSGLLESMDSVNMNLDTQQKIERYLLQPGIEKMVMGRYHLLSERMVPWRSVFLSSGFSPLTLSNFTESQADCLVQRTPVRGFHVEKRQNSLVLCWQRKELISASAWRC